MSLPMIRSSIFRFNILRNISKDWYTTSTKKQIIDDLKIDDVPSFAMESKYTRNQLNKMRKKSGLSLNHENILNNKKPYDKSMEWYHDSLWYRKKILGKYGIEAADINPAIAWPTQEQVEDFKLYEKILYPMSLEKLLEKNKETNKLEALKIKEREERIDSIIVEYKKWKMELKIKLQKKLFENYKTRIKKQRIFMNIKDKYGYAMSARDFKAKEYEKQLGVEQKKPKQDQKIDRFEREIAFIKKKEEMLKKQTKTEI